MLEVDDGMPGKMERPIVELMVGSGVSSLAMRSEKEIVNPFRRM